MRIIGGSRRGRRLRAPGSRFGTRVRPTSDRAREALFNIIAPEVRGGRVLDLFAGTGALGLEALSRGAEVALFVEGGSEVIGLLRENLELCGFAGQARVLRHDCSRDLTFLSPLAPVGGFTLILADPPYGRGLAESTLKNLAGLIRAVDEGGGHSGEEGRAASSRVLAPEGLLVLESGCDEKLPLEAGELATCRESRSYGEARFHFYCRKQPQR